MNTVAIKRVRIVVVSTLLTAVAVAAMRWAATSCALVQAANVLPTAVASAARSRGAVSRAVELTANVLLMEAVRAVRSLGAITRAVVVWVEDAYPMDVVIAATSQGVEGRARALEASA